MKKLASLLLALVMITSCFSAMAASGTNSNDGEITIKDAVVGHTYEIYQILTLESYNTDSDAYAYKATTAWADFVNSATDYLKVDADGYVTWVNEDAADNGSAVAEFAKKALAYADANKISAVQTKVADNTTITFSGLNLGYYLIDTNLGTLCSLDTTTPSVEMYEKNEKPTIDKSVQEDDGGTWGETNTAEVGDTVHYKTTINAKPGAVNYVLHDSMTEGLTLNQDSISISDGTNTLVKGTDYTVSYNVTHDNGTADDATDDTVCDFEIHFTQTYLDKITTDTTLTVTYSAILNDKAVISEEFNGNKTVLAYGGEISGEPEFKTNEEETKTYTFKFDLVKTDSNSKLLEGAKFALYTEKTNGTLIPLVKESTGNYRVATDEEQKADGFVSAIIEGSTAVIEGLDANTTYWLEETEAPAGYNRLTERVEVAITNENLNATIDLTNSTWTDGGVHVINQTGAELPSTGGMGTTILYVGGGILVLAAIVLLIAKRRTSAE